MGGEPLCDENLFLTDLVITSVREHYPDILIYVWTGYLAENLFQ
ncbi:MAG: 4Fe-4S cluster-binding domain-containing protein [Clostridia bacterium]|nr:4Fe-4S cluster-binding domain-containing protein [Clostridia bacterium]